MIFDQRFEDNVLMTAYRTSFHFFLFKSCYASKPLRVFGPGPI